MKLKIKKTNKQKKRSVPRLPGQRGQPNRPNIQPTKSSKKKQKKKVCAEPARPAQVSRIDPIISPHRSARNKNCHRKFILKRPRLTLGQQPSCYPVVLHASVMREDVGSSPRLDPLFCPILAAVGACYVSRAGLWRHAHCRDVGGRFQAVWAEIEGCGGRFR